MDATPRDGMRTIEAAFKRERIWCGRYSLKGQASRAPRTINYWTDVHCTRAEHENGSTWLDGPLGTAIKQQGTADATHRMPEGRAAYCLTSYSLSSTRHCAFSGQRHGSASLALVSQPVMVGYSVDQ